MACSNPLPLYINKYKGNSSHVDFEKLAYKRSLGELTYIEIPCNWCLNCRIDKQSSLIDRCEYEYINYGCGAFVTFTYDDIHLFKNSFIDSHSGETLATINKKDGKDFLNRLNKLVHKENNRLEKLGITNKLCRPDYKYVISYEYGDQFKRPHIHCLFFGLDFAYCERLFWRAWKFQGSIQVGAIKNGGIKYATKYISEQTFGTDAFYKYTYHHLDKPSSSHSLGLGAGLFESQKEYVTNIIENEVDKRLCGDLHYKKVNELTKDWPSYKVQEAVNKDGAPSEKAVRLAKKSICRDVAFAGKKLLDKQAELLERSLEPDYQAPNTVKSEKYEKFNEIPPLNFLNE